MKTHCKLNLPTLNLDIRPGRLINTHPGKTASISYYEIDDVDNSILNAIKFKIDPIRICYAEIVGHGTLGAHRDYGAKTALNFYINSCNATTNFYRTDNHSNKNIFTMSEIELIDSFIAKDNEYYLLNVDQIHSVIFPETGKRTFITWQWTVDFEEVIVSLLGTDKLV
jgi:hypothetical protein